MAAFTHYRCFRGWLRRMPNEVAIVLAARMALRIFPAAWIDIIRNGRCGAENCFQDRILPTARHLGVAWGAAKFPALAQRLSASTEACSYLSCGDDYADIYARAAASTAVAAAAANASERYDSATHLAAFCAGAVADMGYRASKRVAINGATIGAFWIALSQDATRFEQQESPSVLVDAPLWPQAEATEFHLLWQEMKDACSQEYDAPLWATWYDDRLKGCARNRDYALSLYWLKAMLREESNVARD